MARTRSSQRWLTRNAKDPYVKRARAVGARSRATFKLEEIDRRDHLLRPGMTVVDLGAVPGGWSQYVKSRIGERGRVLALDIQPMEPIVGVEFILGDFRENAVLDLVMQQLQGRAVDLVISDMAPSISGVRETDQARIMNLAELALDFTDKALKPGGNVLIKTFQGQGYNDFHAQLRRRFEKVVTRKPSASRSESREIYLVGKGFRPV